MVSDLLTDTPRATQPQVEGMVKAVKYVPCWLIVDPLSKYAYLW